MGNELIRRVQILPDGTRIILYPDGRREIEEYINSPSLPPNRALDSYQCMPRPVVDEPHPMVPMYPPAYPYQAPVYVQHEPPRMVDRPRRRKTRNRYVAAKAIAMVALSFLPTFMIKDGHGFWMTFLGWILIFAWLVAQAGRASD